MKLDGFMDQTMKGFIDNDVYLIGWNKEGSVLREGNHVTGFALENEPLNHLREWWERQTGSKKGIEEVGSK